MKITEQHESQSVDKGKGTDGGLPGTASAQSLGGGGLELGGKQCCINGQKNCCRPSGNSVCVPIFRTLTQVVPHDFQASRAGKSLWPCAPKTLLSSDKFRRPTYADLEAVHKAAEVSASWNRIPVSIRQRLAYSCALKSISRQWQGMPSASRRGWQSAYGRLVGVLMPYRQANVRVQVVR